MKLAHPIDIFSLAVTTTQVLSASGASSIKIHSTTGPDFALVQSLEEAHKIGCHHIVTDAKGSRAVSIGFGGDIKIWLYHDGNWSEDHTTSGKKLAGCSMFIQSYADRKYLAQSALQMFGQLPYQKMDDILLVSLSPVISKCGT